MFTHDSIKGTDGYSTTTQYKCSAVSILVRSETLAKGPISDGVYKQEMVKSQPFFRQMELWVRQTGKTLFHHNEKMFSESYLIFQFRLVFFRRQFC